MAAKPGPLRPHQERKSYVRREPPPRIPGLPDLGDSFLVVTEGEVTEKLYFEKLRALLQISAVTVRVVHPDCTDAQGLVREAIKLRDQQRERRDRFDLGNREVGNYDHVWVVFDTDIPARQHQLGPACELARKEDIRLALSTPCIEFWLRLHFGFTTGSFLDDATAQKAVAQVWGEPYDKTEATFMRLWPVIQPNIPMAVMHAEKVRQHHHDAGTKQPANPCTNVDLLVRALDASVQPEMRIL
jgi:hypothetical protein